jgi:ribosome maturation factor RimP
VSTPGTSDTLRKEREFAAFKGFPVIVQTLSEFKGTTLFEGTLQERTTDHVKVSVKGRTVNIPRALVAEVKLFTAE